MHISIRKQPPFTPLPYGDGRDIQSLSSLRHCQFILRHTQNSNALLLPSQEKFIRADKIILALKQRITIAAKDIMTKAMSRLIEKAVVAVRESNL